MTVNDLFVEDVNEETKWNEIFTSCVDFDAINCLRCVPGIGKSW